MTDDTAATMRLTPDEAGPMLPLCLGGRYRLTERIGVGGMASIYRAYDMHFERTVAVKLMTPKLRSDPEFDARFRREALIVSKLNDPHVIVVHDFGLDSDYGPFLVMELLEGETLRERLNATGPLSVPAALQLGEQIMLALAHAHEHGVIHRDLKPDNVFLLAQSGVKLHVRVLDFGIARMVRNPNQTDRPTETPRGTAVGTPRYMAPEQLAGKQASERSDLFAAAVVLYESLTGHVPELMGPRLRDRCPDAPDGLVRLIEQCLSGDPDERPVSATEAYLQLHELSRSVGGDLLVSPTAVAQLTARFRSDSPVQTKSPTRRLWLAASIATVLMLTPFAWKLWPRRHSLPDQESIAGIRLGDTRDDVVARFGKPISGKPQLLRPFLTLEDVIRPGDTAAPEILSWANNATVVVVVGDEVRAVLAFQSAATGRDLRIGDDEATLRKAYPEPPATARIVADFAPNEWVTLYHFPNLHLTVMTRAGQIAGIAMWK
jgi:serine/threonine protein kinase